MTRHRPSIAIVGAGPSGLIAAQICASAGARVTVVDRMPMPARKFLRAGLGGLNLTHGEPLDAFLSRYGAARERMASALAAFSRDDLVAWCEGLGQKTFVGTSGRVFPEAMKASKLLRAWLLKLDGLGVGFVHGTRWRGFDDARGLRLLDERGERRMAADATVLALGGASWPRLGSDGAWVEILRQCRIGVRPLTPSNCGFVVAWSDYFKRTFAGAPLTGIALSFEGVVARGEAVITQGGIEGGAVYALSSRMREALAEGKKAVAWLDLRPNVGADEIGRRLMVPRGKLSLSAFLKRRLRLSPAAVGLVHEAALLSGARLSGLAPQALAALVKAVPVPLLEPAPIARAISSAGGVLFDEVDEHFMLKKLPGVFVAGEMLDWEAPTGGYLLQGCFSTGVAAARGALRWLSEER